MYEEMMYMHDDAAFEAAEDRRWKREMQDATEIVRCPACSNVELPRPCNLCYGAGELIIPKDETALVGDAPEEASVPPGALPPEIAPTLSTAVHPEEEYGCEYCRESNEDLQAVESSDPETGYYEVIVMCRACRRAPMEREAAAEGGLRPDALMLLGVDESWMYEGSTAPSKPVRREVRREVEGEGARYGD